MSAPQPSASAWHIEHLPARLCVMLSGSGRTLENLFAASGDGRLSATVELVIASRPCRGVEIARERGVETRVEAGEISAGTLARLLHEHRIDVVALAGYLRRVHVPEGWQGRILNIHPSLLPAFGGQGMYGDRVHAGVLAAGLTETGCTVHLVDDRFDTGPVLLQRRCPVLPGDDVSTLASRVFAEERRAYPEALQQFILAHVQHERA